MKVYIREGSDRKLKGALQGYAAAVADLEKLENGRLARADANSPRLKYEKGALTQADNAAENRKSSGRFVWALSSDGKSALFEGYISDHVSGKYATEYDRLKESAAKRTDKDFEGCIQLSSETIRRVEEIKRLAQKATKEPTIDWLTILKGHFQEWKEACPDEPAMAQAGFESGFRALCQANPDITDFNSGTIRNREWKKLENSYSEKDPFRMAMEEIRFKMKKEAFHCQEDSENGTQISTMTHVSNHQRLAAASTPIAMPQPQQKEMSNQPSDIPVKQIYPQNQVFQYFSKIGGRG